MRSLVLKIVLISLILVILGYGQIRRDDGDKAKVQEQRNKTNQTTTEAAQNEGRAEEVNSTPGFSSSYPRSSIDAKPFFSLGSLACPPENDCRDKEKPAKND